MSQIDLKGRAALITGATSGFGWRAAHVIARSGASVAIAGRRTERLDSLADELAIYEVPVSKVCMDMADTDSILAGTDKAEADLGSIDILINNAGTVDASFATKLTLDKIDQVFDVNLRGPFVLAVEIAKRLITFKKPGRIINTSSMASVFYSGHGAALYSTTKAGINRMTEAFAVEWAKFHINVNAIAPGTFHSKMADAMLERMPQMIEAMPRKRVMETSHLESTLLYLLSPASEAVTGTVICVDDGQFPR